MKALPKYNLERHFELLILAGILVISALLRLHNLSYAQNAHPDERHMVFVTESLKLGDLNPHSFAYGSFPFYIVRLITTAVQPLSDRSLYDLIFITGRATCAVFGLLAVVLTWLLGRQVFKDSIIGLTAAALLGFNFLHLQLSRFYTSDIILTTTCLVALYGMALLFEKKTWTGFIIAVVGTGMSLATKVSALMLLPFLTLALLLAGSAQVKVPSLEAVRGGKGIARILGWTLLGILTALLVAFALEPYAVFDYETFRKHTMEQISMARGDWRPPYTIQYEHTLPYLYHLKQIFWYTTGWPVTLAMAAGVMLLVIRVWKSRGTMDTLILAWPLVFFLSTAGLQVKFPRYLLPIYPPLLIMAALGLSFLLRRPIPAERGIASMEEVSPFHAGLSGGGAGRQILPSLQNLVTQRAFLVVMLILGSALLLRIVNLVTLPYALHNDEMNVGLQAREFLAEPGPEIFGAGWLNYADTGFYIISYFLRIFGNNLFGLRMYAVAAGIFSLLGLFLLARELSGTKTALFALIFASLSHLHLHYSRAGFIYILPLGFSVWSLFFLAKAGRSKIIWNSLLGGMFAALASLCGGQGWTTLLAALLWLLSSWITRKLSVLRCGVILFCAAGAFAFGLLPYLITSGSNPLFLGTGDFIFRENNLNHLRNAYHLMDLRSIVQHQVLQALRVFLWAGDNSMQYGFRGPWFDPAVLILYAAGLLFVLNRTWRVPSLAVCWLIVDAVFNHLLSINTPYSPRALGTVFAVSLLSAQVFAKFLDHLQTAKAVISTAAVVIAVSAAFNIYSYFIAYSESHQGSRRDEIVRLAAQKPGISTIVNLFPEAENFSYESYRFMTPNASGRNASMDAPKLEWQARSLLIAPAGMGPNWERGREFYYRVQGP